jgi:hypothetical protein
MRCYGVMVERVMSGVTTQRGASVAYASVAIRHTVSLPSHIAGILPQLNQIGDDTAQQKTHRMQDAHGGLLGGDRRSEQLSRYEALLLCIFNGHSALGKRSAAVAVQVGVKPAHHAQGVVELRSRASVAVG